MSKLTFKKGEKNKFISKIQNLTTQNTKHHCDVIFEKQFDIKLLYETNLDKDVISIVYSYITEIPVHVMYKYWISGFADHPIQTTFVLRINVYDCEFMIRILYYNDKYEERHYEDIYYELCIFDFMKSSNIYSITSANELDCGNYEYIFFNWYMKQYYGKDNYISLPNAYTYEFSCYKKNNKYHMKCNADKYVICIKDHKQFKHLIIILKHIMETTSKLLFDYISGNDWQLFEKLISTKVLSCCT